MILTASQTVCVSLDEHLFSSCACKITIKLVFYQYTEIFREKILCLTSAAGILSDQTTIMNSCFSFPLFYVVFVFRINSCPNNCSEHGKCTTSVSVPSRVYCECDKYWKGEAVIFRIVKPTVAVQIMATVI